MFIPVLALRYALTPNGSIGFGHPLGAGTLDGMLVSSVPASVAVPLVTKMRRASADWRSSGANVCVMTCAPVVFTSHDLFHSSRIVIWPS